MHQGNSMGGIIVFSTKGGGTIGKPHLKKKKLDLHPTVCTKVNSRLIIDLSATAETIKFLENRQKFYDLGLIKYLLGHKSKKFKKKK